MSSAPGSLGAVYDRGYRPYDGPLAKPAGGHAGPVSHLDPAGARAAAVLAPEGAPVDPAGHRDDPGDRERRRRLPHTGHAGRGLRVHHLPGVRRGVAALLLFVALTAPDVVCPDRRHRVLPLIFARPLVGREYVLAKVGAIATILFGFSFLPQVVLFVGQMLVSDAAFDYLRENAEVIWQVPAGRRPARRLLRRHRRGARPR